MQEPKESQEPFFVRNGVSLTPAEIVKRLNETSDEIYRRTLRNQANWVYIAIPSVEIKTYDD